MYGLNDRDYHKEMEKRYNALVNVMSDLLNCGQWDIEELFDSNNNIEVGQIVKEYVKVCGNLPDWNKVYKEAFFDFAYEHNLKIGKDIDIYTNGCMDTHIYVREDLDKDIIEEFENLFNMEANILP